MWQCRRFIESCNQTGCGNVYRHCINRFNAKTNTNILENNVPFNMEADSLNCIVLGEDVTPGYTGVGYFY